MARRTASLATLIVFALSAGFAEAQEPPSHEPPGHIAFVDGAAVLERDGRIDSDPASMPLLAGDRLRTQAGRVEVLFPDGGSLHLDSDTVVDFQSDEVIRLLEGRIRLAISGQSRDIAYRIDAPSAWVQISDPGEYRVGLLRNADVELAVLRGAAELVNEQGRSVIRAGERTFAREGAAPSAPYVYNSASWDAFDRWSESRRDRRLGVSAQYLPSDVRPYAASLDAYGDWRYEQTYGYVWYPRVHVGWRPYHRGRWVSLRPYGWTWIAGDPWGWPTHHYGRWGVSAGSWYWIPGRHWGPAWVSWAHAADYVSWCPLGWNNRPVFNIIDVNVYRGRRYSPWDGWTVLPRRHFAGGYVNVASFSSVRIDQRIHNTFVVRNAGPDTRYAVGRAAPIRSTGRYAVPRSAVAGSSAPDAGVTPSRGANARAGASDSRAPSAAPALGTSPAPARSRATRQSPDTTAGTGDRAVSRERAAGSAGVTTWRDSPGESRGADPGQSRRAPGSRRDGGDPGAVTAPPDGAVRAVPRSRQPSAGSASDSRVYSIERPRREGPSAAQPAAPTYSVPAREPRASAPEPGGSRNAPEYRRAPDGGDGQRSRAMPRHESPRGDAPSRPAYGAGPEQRRGPSGPPSGGVSQEPRSRDAGSGSGSARERSGGGGAQNGGQGRRRR